MITLYSEAVMKIENLLPIWHQNYNKSTWQALIGFTFCLMLSQVNAAVVTKDIIVGMGVTHDSNPAMAEFNKEPVWIYTIAPQFKLDATSGVNLWYLDAALLIQRHSNEKVLVNREDPKVAIGWDRTYERGLFGLKADYIESSARADELKATGVFVQADNTEKIKVLSAKWLHDIDPKWSVLTEGAYRDVTFTLPGSLESYQLGNFNSKLTYANTEKLDTYVQVGYFHYMPDKIYDNTNFYRLDIGANYQLKEKLSLGVHGGPYHITGRQSDSGWEAGVTANYAQDRMTYTAGLSRSLGAGGIGGFQTRDVLDVTWSFDISNIDRMGAGYSITKTRKDASINTENIDYQDIGAFYERDLSNHWKSRFSAGLRDIDGPATQSQGNIIGVTLVYDTLSF